jgi:Spy/CpxP family protein refolding chaperone
VKRSHKAAAAIAAALSLGIAAAAFAQPGNGSHPKAGMQHGKMDGMQHGKMDGMQHGKMDATQHAQATREAMQKRAKEKRATAQSDTHTH